ncbi:MAG: hypothetical protein KY469_15160 [Actinobacteria bacterium]|nr:hypothetical protein [Actinomycetota bacterium]
MSRAERRRAELFDLFVPTVGKDAAAMLLDELPASGVELATRSQVAALEERLDARFAQVDARFMQVDARFDALEQRLDDRLAALRDEMLAAFRGELVAAVSGQTRQIIIATATAVFGIGGLAVTLAQVL